MLDTIAMKVFTKSVVLQVLIQSIQVQEFLLAHLFRKVIILSQQIILLFNVQKVITKITQIQLQDVQHVQWGINVPDLPAQD